MSLQVIDDRDLAVSYTGNWTQFSSRAEHNLTTTYAYMPGAAANLKFRGTSVSVHGTIRPVHVGFASPISSYSVDGSTPVSYRANQTQNIQYNQQFYQSPVLPDGDHTLVVTNTLYSDPLYLDYFIVQPANGTSSWSPSSSTGPPQSSTTGSSGSVSRRTIAVIVGSTVGGVAGVIILLTIFYFWFRRQRGQDQSKPQPFDPNIVSSFPHDPTSVTTLSSKATEGRDILHDYQFTPSTANVYRASNYSNHNAFPQIYEVQNEPGPLQRQTLPPQNPSYPDDTYPYDLYFNPAIPPGYVPIDPNQNQDSHPPTPSAIRVLPSKLMAKYQ